MKKKVQIGIGVLLGAVIVYFLFRGTNWHEVVDSLRRVHPFWLLVSLMFIVASFFARVQRWSYIVRVAKPVSFRSMFSATQIMFLVNFIIPGRVGEVVRAIVLTRLTRLPFSKSVAMGALDRVTDLVGLIVVMLISVIGFPIVKDVVIPANTLNNVDPIVLPQHLLRQGELLTAVMLVVLVAGLIVVYLSQTWVIAMVRKAAGLISETFAEKVAGMVQHFSEGLHIFRSAADMAKSIAWSLLTWSCFIFAVMALMEAFAMPWPWYTPFVLQTLLAIFVAAPIMPGLVGQFHLPIVVAIVATIPEVPPSEAMALAILAHLFNVIPVGILGIYCLYREKFGFMELSREVAHPEELEALAGPNGLSQGAPR